MSERREEYDQRQLIHTACRAGDVDKIGELYSENKDLVSYFGWQRVLGGVCNQLLMSDDLGKI